MWLFFLQRECHKLRKICREMHRPLSSVLPVIDAEDAGARLRMRRQTKSTEPPKIVSSHDHGSLRRFKLPAVDKIKRLLHQDRKRHYTRDNDKEARQKVRLLASYNFRLSSNFRFKLMLCFVADVGRNRGVLRRTPR